MFFCCYISAIRRVFHMFLHDEKPYEDAFLHGLLCSVDMI